MRFTPLEAQILLHRLEVVDAIAEAIETPVDLVADACRILTARLIACDVFEPTDFETVVLRDAADGCTFFAGIDDEVATGGMSRGRLAAWMKAADGIERKLAVQVPRE